MIRDLLQNNPDSQEANIGSWNRTGHGNGWRGWWEHNGPLYLLSLSLRMIEIFHNKQFKNFLQNYFQ